MGSGKDLGKVISKSPGKGSNLEFKIRWWDLNHSDSSLEIFI